MIKKVMMLGAMYAFSLDLLLAKCSTDVAQTALSLCSKGKSYLLPKLQEPGLLQMYSEEENYIQQFPFDAYAVSEVPFFGKYYIDAINDTIKNSLRAHIPWEVRNTEIIKRYVKKGTIAVDIGAHIGTHTLTMSQCVGNGCVVAFEPNKKIFRELCLNLALNDCKNTFPIRCAIGKTGGVISSVCSHPNNEGGTYVINNQQGDTAIVTLDDFKLTNVSFIKIDVENMEAEVIDGAMETLRRNRPVILIEIQGNSQRAIVV